MGQHKDTAHRPSQSDQEFVLRSDGTKVRNTAYKSPVQKGSGVSGKNTPRNHHGATIQLDDNAGLYHVNERRGALFGAQEEAVQRFLESDLHKEKLTEYANVYTSNEEDREYYQDLLAAELHDDISTSLYGKVRFNEAEKSFRSNPNMTIKEYCSVDDADVHKDTDIVAYTAAVESGIIDEDTPFHRTTS